MEKPMKITELETLRRSIGLSRSQTASILGQAEARLARIEHGEDVEDPKFCYRLRHILNDGAHFRERNSWPLEMPVGHPAILLAISMSVIFAGIITIIIW